MILKAHRPKPRTSNRQFRRLAANLFFTATILAAAARFFPGPQPSQASTGSLSFPDEGSSPAAARRGNATILEFPITYSNPPSAVSLRLGCMSAMESAATSGSTHELAFDPNGGSVIWVTGQNYDMLARVNLTGQMDLFSLPAGSGPHGIDFDAAGRLWVTLEFAGKVARIDDQGRIVAQYDVSLACATCPSEINSHPHGLGIGPDGQTVWYTGKGTGTVGRITPDGQVQNYALPTVGSVPIYIKAGPDGNMWVTELVGNKIARVTPGGDVSEFPIPTYNSRPIAILPGPDGAMWFSEESSNKIARIDLNGNITEFQLPKRRRNLILAALTFDSAGNLWTQQYVNQNDPLPKGNDYIVKIDKSILNIDPSQMRKVPITLYPVPTRETVLHRIVQGPDSAIWFTELAANKIARLLPR